MTVQKTCSECNSTYVVEVAALIAEAPDQCSFCNPQAHEDLARFNDPVARMGRLVLAYMEAKRRFEAAQSRMDRLNGEMRKAGLPLVTEEDEKARIIQELHKKVAQLQVELGEWKARFKSHDPRRRAV